MKKTFFFLFTILSLSSLSAQGIVFFHGSFAEALDKAKKENKLIFMDAFAEWCGPCKRMAATVFTDEKVGKYFNDNFVNLKIDMEKGEGPTLSRKFGVEAYPTLLFINEKGDLVHKGVGALDPTAFVALGKNAVNKIDNSKDFEKAYNEGKREPELILNYVRALNRAGKPSGKVVNDYLAKADMSNPNTLKIVYEGTVQADSKIFDLLIQKRADITPLFSEQQMKDKIETAIQRTLENAVQFKNEALHKEAKAKMKSFLPEKAESFAIEADMKFFKAMNDAKNYCKTCSAYVKKEGNGDARMLFAVAKQMIDAFPYDKTALNDAEKYFKKAAENGGMSDYYYWYAHTLMRNAKKKEALEAAEKALKIARESTPNYVSAIEDLIRQIKES